MKYLLTIEYNGTYFEGWQVQPNSRTVQGEIEKVLSLLLNDKTNIFGSGRTDSGVHALGQTAHFETNKILNTRKFLQALNANLPKDIRVLKMKKVANDFHARFNVKEKVYLYKLSSSPSVFEDGFVGKHKKPLNISAMQDASRFLIGTHDFTSFSSAKTETKDFIRTINYIKITKHKNLIQFEISGNGFLYNMVRIIVGTLCEIGEEKCQPEDIKNILNARDRTKAGKTAPACGLYLKKVKY